MDKVKNNFKEYWKVFLFESLLFLISIFLAIISTQKRIKLLDQQNVSLDYISISSFIIQFTIITVFLILISKFLKKKKHKGALFRSLFILAVYTGGVFVFNLWFSDILSLILMGFLIIVWSKSKNILIHNLSVILGIVGTVSITALNLKPSTIIILLIVFSIYDFIAVYKTKHMVKMAKSMIQSGSILGLVIPRKTSFFNKKVDSVDRKWAFVLGGGDVAFPLLLICSLIPVNFFSSIIVAFFAIIGLFFSFYYFISQKEKRAIPALPPIALFSIIGYFIGRFLI
jgi:presenilin-like A22 family membrane protease